MGKTMNKSAWNMENANTAITITLKDGTTITTTYANLEKARKAKKRAENKGKKKVKTDIQLLPSQIERLVKGVKAINSLRAFYDNGYRQWGTIARTIMDNKFIRSHYVKFRAVAYEISELQDKINEIGKGNEKAIFAYVQKMAYKIDDAKRYMENLARGVEDSHVCETYQHHEVINGEGKRLGLRILMMRTMWSINDMENLFKELTSISEEGLDVMEYCPINGKRI